MKRPLTGLVLVYASGIWVGSWLQWPVSAWCCGAISSLAAFVLLRRSRWAFGALMALVFFSGAFTYRQAVTISSSDHIGRILTPRDQNAAVRGVIVSDPGYHGAEEVNIRRSSPQRHRFKLRLEALEQYGEWRPTEGTLLVFVSETRDQQPLCYGDLIECSAILRVPPPARNPGTFDWHGWLARQGIQFTATIRREDSCAILARDNGNRLIALSLRLAERFERALQLGFEDEPELAGVLAAMIVGSRSEIPPDTYAEFQQTGVFHIFSISGLHVALVMGVVILVLGTIRVPGQWCGLVAIPVLILYVFATGACPGAMRSLVMACVWLIGRALVRPSDSLNTLAAAALAILLWDPTQLFDGGFVLSFVSVGALVALTLPIQACFEALVQPDPFLPRPYVPRWRRLLNGPIRWLGLAVSSSLAAWIGLLPLMAWYFHLFTPISIVANVVVIPLLGAITALGMLALPAQTVWPWLALTFNNANYFLLSMMMRIIEWLGGCPGGYWFVLAPPLWVMVGYYGVGILLLHRRLLQSGRFVAAVAALVLCAVAVYMLWPRDKVEITVLDMDDGQSVFMNAPGERDDWLIDGGGDWSARRVVLPFLRGQGVDRLGAMVLTCADEAHAAGLILIAGEIPVDRAIESGAPSRSKYCALWRQTISQNQHTASTVCAGDELLVANRLKVRVLNPSREVKSNRGDDNALVLLLEFGPTRLLLMSDAGATVENRLLASGEDLHAQIVIKGRHGKEPSCTDDFLDAVRPETVVQTAGERPGDGYPETELRERLPRRGIRLYRTDETGAVSLDLTRRGYVLRTWLP